MVTVSGTTVMALTRRNKQDRFRGGGRESILAQVKKASFQQSLVSWHLQRQVSVFFWHKSTNTPRTILFGCWTRKTKTRKMRRPNMFLSRRRQSCPAFLSRHVLSWDIDNTSSRHLESLNIDGMFFGLIMTDR